MKRKFFAAVKEGDSNEFLNLLNEGIDVNTKDSKDNSALHFAVSEALIYSPNGKAGEPLVLQGRNEILNLLLNRGVDINAANKFGHTALHEATNESNVKMVEYLIKKGANVNAVSSNGNTPLHLAAKRRKGIDYAKLLLKYGANYSLENKSKQTAFDIAGYRKLGVKWRETILDLEDRKNIHDVLENTTMVMGNVVKGCIVLATASCALFFMNKEDDNNVFKSYDDKCSAFNFFICGTLLSAGTLLAVEKKTGGVSWLANTLKKTGGTIFDKAFTSTESFFSR